MNDQDQNSEDLEVATHETDHDVSQQDEQSHQADAQAREDANDRNWRAMRQRHKEMETAIQQRDQMIDKLLNQQPKQNVQVIEEPEDADDDFVPAGKVKGIARKTVQPLE